VVREWKKQQRGPIQEAVWGRPLFYFQSFRNSSGNFATFAPILRASSLLSSLAHAFTLVTAIAAAMTQTTKSPAKKFNKKFCGIAVLNPLFQVPAPDNCYVERRPAPRP
jgi:hypothetical protein